jgi:hypothetical protein
VQLERLLGRSYLAGPGPAVGGELGVLLGHRNTVLADNDAVQISWAMKVPSNIASFWLVALHAFPSKDVGPLSISSSMAASTVVPRVLRPMMRPASPVLRERSTEEIVVFPNPFAPRMSVYFPSCGLPAAAKFLNRPTFFSRDDLLQHAVIF